jgi:hypothetical protein
MKLSFLIISFFVLFLNLSSISAQVFLINQGFDTVGSDGTPVPEGWTFTGIGGIYTSASGSGLNPPSLKMDATNDVVMTPEFANPDQLSFWIRGYSVDTLSSLLVEEYYSGEWHIIINMNHLPVSETIQTYILNSATTSVRFTYTKSAGNLALDDVQITSLESSSGTSDIIKKSGWSEPTNIDYKNYQADDIQNDGNSIEAAKFTLRDGGGISDDDILNTILTSISLNIENYNNIKRIALYDGDTEIGSEQNAAASVTFSGLAVTSLDNSTKDFSIRVSFNSTVSDHQNIKFTISSAVSDLSGSSLNSSNAGGSSTDNSGDNNKIEVIADRLNFTMDKPPATVTKNVNFNAEVKAVDLNNNLDLDMSNSVTLSVNSGSGLLSSTTGLIQNLASGIFSWSDVNYNTAEIFTITASSAGLASVTSENIICNASPVADHVVIAEIYGGGGNSGATFQNDYVILFNPTNADVSLSGYSLQYASSSGNFSSANKVDLNGSVISRQYFAIMLAGGANGDALPFTANITNTAVNVAAANGKIALVENQDVITNINDPDVIDFVGYGTGNEFEGIASAPSPGSSNTKSLRRKDDQGNSTYGLLGNGYDSENNNLDFYLESDLITNQPLSVELISFNAEINEGLVILHWKTASEINNFGFEVERSQHNSDWKTIGFVKGSGSSCILKEYTYSDNFLKYGQYTYRLKQVNTDGTFEYSEPIDVSIDKYLNLGIRNYPNPFNPRTKIILELPYSSKVRLTIFNIIGQVISTIVNESLDKGIYEWNFDGSNLPSGIYLYNLQAGEKSISNRMILMK